MRTRLDLALIRLHPGLSRRAARAAIEKGQVTVNGRPALQPGCAVGPADSVAWDPNRRALPRARLDLPLLYRDDALLIVDKPAGLLSIPTAPGVREEDTALGRVQEFVSRLRPRDPYVGTVHRLDRGTSGALAFALSEPARHGLRALFRAHRVERRYLAIVRGLPRSDREAIDLPIHDSYVSGKRRVAGPGEPSHAALTRYLVRERFHGAALLEVELETGRQHQIRVHLSHAGTPILGDSVYGTGAGGPRGLAVSRPMLHAVVLGLSHPLTGVAVRVEAPPPSDFVRVLASLRARVGPRDTQPAAGPGRQRR